MKTIILVLALCAVSAGAADQPQISVLTIETANAVNYVGDVNDPAKLALVQGATTTGTTRAFTESITVADVVPQETSFVTVQVDDAIWAFRVPAPSHS